MSVCSRVGREYRRRAGHTCAQIDQVWDQGAPYGQQRIEEVHEIEHDDDEEEAARGQRQAQEEGP